MNQLEQLLSLHPLACFYQVQGGFDDQENKWTKIAVFRYTGAGPYSLGDNKPFLAHAQSKDFDEAVDIVKKKLQSLPSDFKGYTDVYLQDILDKK